MIETQLVAIGMRGRLLVCRSAEWPFSRRLRRKRSLMAGGNNERPWYHAVGEDCEVSLRRAKALMAKINSRKF